MADRGISPRVTGTVDLGSASKAWRKLYAGRIDEGTYIPGAFNKKETFTTSGTFTAPVTGVYRITLHGGGGGGGGSWSYNNIHGSGGGGGSGGRIEFFANMTAGESISYTIGAGGTGGTAGSTTNSTGGTGGNGGNSSITVGGKTFVAEGGDGGSGYFSFGTGGVAGFARIDGNIVFGISVSSGSSGSAGTIGVAGGGGGDGSSASTRTYNGGGGSGGRIKFDGTYESGVNGGDGYIVFEYYDPTA